MFSDEQIKTLLSRIKNGLEFHPFANHGKTCQQSLGLLIGDDVLKSHRRDGTRLHVLEINQSLVIVALVTQLI